MAGIMRELNLSPGQKTEIKGIRQRARERQRAVRFSYASPAVKRSETKRIRAHAREEIMRVLSPAQRERLVAIRTQWR
jgi:Spy/CpxP family protein refolding chaperone